MHKLLLVNCTIATKKLKKENSGNSCHNTKFCSTPILTILLISCKIIYFWINLGDQFNMGRRFLDESESFIWICKIFNLWAVDWRTLTTSMHQFSAEEKVKVKKGGAWLKEGHYFHFLNLCSFSFVDFRQCLKKNRFVWKCSQ